MSLQLNHSGGLRIEKDDLQIRLKPSTFKDALKMQPMFLEGFIL